MKFEYVDKKDLKGFQAKTLLFGRHGKGYNKKITMVVCPINKRIWYNLENHHALEYSGPNLDVAISRYNEL